MDSMMDTGGDYDLDSLLLDLEQKELEGNGFSVTDCETFLALYLALNDLINARFLWQRIPPVTKEQSPSDLNNLWEIGKHLIKSEFAMVFKLVDTLQWPPHLAAVIGHLRKELQKRNLQLIAKSYSSIRFEDAMKMTGSSTQEEMISLVQSQGWMVDPAFGFVISRKTAYEEDNQASNQEQLEKLADYVSFLENY